MTKEREEGESEIGGRERRRALRGAGGSGSECVRIFRTPHEYVELVMRIGNLDECLLLCHGLAPAVG